ncbi:MAG: hypothetical protein V2A76_19395 [Planctomycetota bacterium]
MFAWSVSLKWLERPGTRTGDPHHTIGGGSSGRLFARAGLRGLANDAASRTSFDGQAWSDPTQVTFDDAHFDTQSHPLRSGVPGRVILGWSHQDSATPYVDHDVWVDPDLPLPLPLWLDGDTISASTGGAATFALDAGSANAGREYVVSGSLSVTSPGFPLPGGLATLPLNFDVFFQFVLANLNTPICADFLGTLDASGRATATFDTLGPLPPVAVGVDVYFAYALRRPYEFVSNPVIVTIIP